MIHTPDEPTLDWYGAGYDPFIDAPEREQPRAGWSLLRAGISRARRGDFSLVGTVARTIIAHTMDPRLHQVAAEFVADAGDAADLEVLVLALATIDRERGLDIVHALAARGRLVDVPAVFRFYEVHREHPECDSIPARLSWLLSSSEDGDDDPSEHSWAEYRAAVARRYFDLWSRLGTNLIHVRRGRAYDLRTLVHDILGDLRDGFLDGDDRRAFEVTTGRSCSAWFTDGQASFLTVAADLEDFLASGVVGPPPGQRAFMGHPLENAGAAAGVLAAYPQSRGMGVPEVRTTFDVDAYFSLPLGFEPFHGGYFVRSTQPPPTVEWLDTKWPWLSLHVGLRAAKGGDASPLATLATWIDASTEPILRSALIHLVSRAAADRVLASWRDTIRTCEDPALTLTLCEGLLRRGLLCDIPRVLAAYLRHAEDPDYAHLQDRFNLLLAFRSISHEPGEPMPPAEFQALVTREVQRLRREFGRDEVPVFRGGLLDVGAIAREIVELRRSPYVTFDLREWFEAATGIDCTPWEVADPPDLAHAFDTAKAAASAQEFLANGAESAYRPGTIYFFGHPVDAAPAVAGALG